MKSVVLKLIFLLFVLLTVYFVYQIFKSPNVVSGDPPKSAQTVFDEFEAINQTLRVNAKDTHNSNFTVMINGKAKLRNEEIAVFNLAQMLHLIDSLRLKDSANQNLNLQKRLQATIDTQLAATTAINEGRVSCNDEICAIAISTGSNGVMNNRVMSLLLSPNIIREFNDTLIKKYGSNEKYYAVMIGAVK